MYEYKCKVCRKGFEASIVQTRCPTFKCQARQIKEVSPKYKGVTYSNLNWTLEDEGEKYERIRDRQHRRSRNITYNDEKIEWEEKKNA